MDRKTFLAITLSLLVLVGYQVTFVVPQRTKALKNSQTAAAVEDRETLPESGLPQPIVDYKTPPVSIEAKNYTFGTPSFSADVSNVGGALHNLKVLPSTHLPIANVVGIKGLENAAFVPMVTDDDQQIYSYADANWKIKKTITVGDNNTFLVRMEIVPFGTMSKLDDIEFLTIAIDYANLPKVEEASAMVNEYSVFFGKKMMRKGSASKFSSKENKTVLGKVVWTGFRDQHNTIVVRPEFETSGYETLTNAQTKLNIYLKAATGEGIKRQGTYEFTVFVGPQDAKLMGKYNKQFEKIVAFSNFWLIDVIAMAIYYTIPVIHNIVHSWGMSIILISLLIYALSYPLTLKSMTSMRKMQLMQPKIKALQERYKGDPQKLNSEVMEIYRREKINPLGGCLPFLLQMPLFIALYQVLWRSYYFQGHSFLWIKDLALPDRLFILPFSLPFLGNEFNILPILMGLVMFAQQKVSSKNMVITDEQQAMQQKMMMYFFPVFIAFIFYKFASGLSLYFTVFYALSTLTQMKLSKAPVK
jgi:YidC/Oxa1 family membrane protein insertase